MNPESEIKESLLAALARARRGGRLMVEATTPGGRPRPLFPSGRLKVSGKKPDGFERILCICPMGGIEFRVTGAPAGRWRLRAADGREVFLSPRTPPPSRSSSRSRTAHSLVHEHELINVEKEEDVAMLFETEWEVAEDFEIQDPQSEPPPEPVYKQVKFPRARQKSGPRNEQLTNT